MRRLPQVISCCCEVKPKSQGALLVGWCYFSLNYISSSWFRQGQKIFREWWWWDICILLGDRPRAKLPPATAQLTTRTTIWQHCGIEGRISTRLSYVTIHSANIHIFLPLLLLTEFAVVISILVRFIDPSIFQELYVYVSRYYGEIMQSLNENINCRNQRLGGRLQNLAMSLYPVAAAAGTGTTMSSSPNHHPASYTQQQQAYTMHTWTIHPCVMKDCDKSERKKQSIIQ